MQKRQLGIVLSLVVVVVVVGVAALLWLSLRSPRPIASRNEAAANAPPQAVVTAHEAAAERSELDRARSSVEPSPPARSEDAGEEDVPVLVRVVDGATEQPVPGARVLFWDEASWAARLAVPDDAALHTSGDDEDWLLAHGRIAHCDASGEVRIHATPLTVLRAEFEGAVGIGMLEHASEIRVAILPERSVAVRLLSADRRPVAGVEVGINALDAAGVPVCDHAMREVVTDAAGLARFRHLQWPSQDLSALREAVPFAVRPSLPGCRSLFATFLPTSPPAEPIELVLPETGSLVLRWPAAGGNSNRYASVHESGNCWSSTGRGRAQDEDVVFEHVPIGRRYRVYDGAASREVDGPKVAGEVVLVELVDETTVSIALVLQDADGHVLAGRDCCVHLRNEAGLDARNARTDAAGRMVCVLPRWLAGRSIHCVVDVPPKDGERSLRTSPVEGVLALGVNELGVCRAVDAEPLVAGTVLRHGGGQQLRPRLLVERWIEGSDRWWEVRSLQAKFDETRFVIDGYVPAGAVLRLRCADGDLLVGGPRTFVPGQRDVALEVRPAVQFETRARFDPAVVPRVEVELFPLDLPAAEFASLGLAPGAPLSVGCFDLVADRAIYSQGVPAGSYDLQFRLRGFPGVLARVDRVVVGGDRVDPRLFEVDLRGKLANLVVDVVDGQGEPQGGRITALGATNVGPGERIDFGANDTLLVPAGPQDLLLFWPDYPPVELRGAIGRVRVQVSPWRSSEVVVCALPALPAGFSYQIEVGDVRRRDWSKLASYASCIGDAQPLVNGRARLQFGDGPAPVRLQVLRTSDSMAQEVAGLSPDQLVASDTPIEVRAPSVESIQAALAMLQAKSPR